ncbi:hypothetical protein GUJ93_ZPchr0006g44629 [Zizania palustris]|uniref:Uncharacterized protein n=1 Tax=Zizania palustris TaxID=103762 RepID=A0A8J5W2K3_ZIZPA|nr:hypothetical protein GUJ93_ZPchr0006g44629 [Zizania palustris]
MHVASLVKLPWNGATNLSMAYRTLDKSVDEMVEDFELGLKTAAVDNYSRRLVEFCSLQALQVITSLDLGDKIHDGSLSRFTFDMMLAWETPTPSDQQITMESIAKEREERKEPLGADGAVMGDETSLFYSDIMPLLVNEEPTVGEDTYVWFGSLFPLACDVINARFTFEALTATTASRLHYPAHDRFLKEMNKSLKFLQEVPTPTGIELAADEFILHMEGTAGTQRVVRHIGTASWPGRLTLTNKALYFEASGKISYKPALKVELSATEIEQQVKTTSTGPFGAPLFDKGIKFELLEPLVLEFPEMTSSTRRDMWITLIREVIFLHRFISMYSIDSPIHKWEVHSRIILGVIRLHAAREMLRMSPLPPSSFLVFSLYGELPKGDFVLEQLASNLKETSTITSLSASHVFKGLSKSLPVALSAEIAEDQHDRDSGSHERPLASLENTIGQVRDEAREATVANAAIEGMEEEGIIDSLLVLVVWSSLSLSLSLCIFIRSAPLVQLRLRQGSLAPRFLVASFPVPIPLHSCHLLGRSLEQSLPLLILDTAAGPQRRLCLHSEHPERMKPPNLSRLLVHSSWHLQLSCPGLLPPALGTLSCFSVSHSFVSISVSLLNLLCLSYF